MAAFEYSPFNIYVLEPGTKIYKGDNQKFFDHYLPHRKVTLTRGPAFFAITPAVAKTYGVVFEFVIKERLLILDLDHNETVRNLYTQAPDDIKEIIELNYGLHTKIRDSTHAADRAFSQYLCDKGLNGYVLKKAKTDSRGTFHPEIMLCDMTKLEFVRIVKKPSNKEIEALQEKMLSDKLKKEQEEKRLENKKSRTRRLSMEYVASPQFKHSSPTKRTRSVHHSPGKQLFRTPTKTPPKTPQKTPPKTPQMPVKNLFSTP